MAVSVEAQEWMLCLFGGLVAVYLMVLLSPEREDDEFSAGPSRSGSQSILLRLFWPLIRLMSQLIGALPLEAHREKLRKRLSAAGRPGGFSPDEFDATRIIAVLLGAAAGAYFDLEAETSPVIALMMGALGFIYPDMWLTGVIQKRRRTIFRTLPDTLDILRLAVDAGLDLSSALKTVVERGRRGPLLDELEAVEREMSLGRTRKDALRHFADRIGMTEINAFVLAIIQADQLGASIGPVLRTQSEMARTRRWQTAEALVNKMPMKMLGPLVLFIFPSSFIILFTPLVIQWMQSD